MDLRRASDVDLFSALQNGNDTAFETIYQRYWSVLYKHALRMMRDEDSAKDIIQEVFTSFYQKYQGIELKSSLSAYLYSAVRNKILDTISKEKVRNNYLSTLNDTMSEGEFYTDQLVREKELSKVIEKEVALLPEKMKRVFLLSRMYDMSYKQISEELSISDNTVKKQISNALKILRLKLDATIAIFLWCLIDAI
ncbi:MAG: RNA polymerase sigma-70 factor [Pedobacter sp.]|nr:MAG: RNA polymerase sigma-70 factor [Pedobacter sp.]